MIVEWRGAVVTYLKEQLENVSVLPGFGDGVVRDTDTVYVWWPGWQRLQRDISLSTPTLNLRYFPNRSKQQTTSVPPDPSDLEAAADALIGAFSRSTEVAGFFTAGLACYLQSCQPNYDPTLWRVEATLASYALGPAA